ncbi:MAG: hypothetical protein M3072_15690, partial [Candidatus Dormibacteraeota bacterium]|nr:hypothetical protein [Candidatus Dormibacteraeota bacterium]
MSAKCSPGPAALPELASGASQLSFGLVALDDPLSALQREAAQPMSADAVTTPAFPFEPASSAGRLRATGAPLLEHPVTAYLNGLAPSSRRPQLPALDWIARRATQLYTAET